MSFLSELPVINYFFPESEISFDHKTILNIKIDKSDLSDFNFINGCEKIFQEIDFSHQNNLNFVNSDSILENPKDICGIVFEINSNGGYGESLMLSNLVNKIRNDHKIPIVSHIKNAYSAGYMLPSLCSDKIFISNGGQIGSVGGYIIEENYSEILKKIGLDVHVFSSEGTSDYKFHNEFLPISKETEDFIVQNLTKQIDKYFDSLEKMKPQIFNNSESKEFSALKYGFDLTSDEAFKLGAADEIGELIDALNFVKNLELQKSSNLENFKFDVIQISNKSFNNDFGNNNFNNSFSLKDIVLETAIKSLIEEEIKK